MMGFASDKKKWAQYFLLFILVVTGLLGIVLFGFNSWTALIVAMAFLLVIPFIITSIKWPEFIVFIAILSNFTPLSVNIGFYFILLMMLILFINNIFKGLPLVKTDTILVLWSLLAILAILTLPKWVSIFKGLRGSLSLFVIPTLLYILFNHGYLSHKGAIKMLSTYFPLIFTCIILQLLLLVIKGTAVSGYSFQEFHGGFDLGWGKSVFVAGLTIFYVMLSYQTKIFWYNNYIIRSLIYFNLAVSSVVVILIAARASFVSFFIALLIYFLFKHYYYRENHKIKSSYIISLLLLMTFVYYFFGGFIGFLVSRFVNMKTDPSFLVRAYMYNDGLVTFLKNVFIGVGPEQHLFKDFLNYVTDPNNIFISYAVSFGIFGLLIITIMFLMPYIKMARLYKNIQNKNVKYFGSLLLPVITIAVINSCFEVIITSLNYGYGFWTVYALFFRLYDHKIDF